jgi:hypothetical protein
MNRCFFSRQPLVAALAIACASFLPARASSLKPSSVEDQIASANAIFRGNVLELHAFEGDDGGIYTRALIQVDEIFKGKTPKQVRLVHRGGTLADKGETDGASPNLKVGEERIFMVSRRADGTLFARNGFQSALPVSVNKTPIQNYAAGQNLLDTLRTATQGGVLAGDNITDQEGSSEPTPQAFQPSISPPSAPVSTATNLLVGGDGIPARFVLPDRGEPIPYLIDADFLPAGMTQTQAVNAVKTALAAWTNACSVRYVFAGIQSFGQAAAKVPASDGVLRIQLHDHYNYIGGGTGSGDVLGEGGHGWTLSTTTNGWTAGGMVKGNDFYKAIKGYIVLAHTNTFMQNLSNFTEVLCHEIGHTIGLDHSSENFPEPNPILNQAIMYWMAHGNGRGATLNSFDTNTCRQVHPVDNTPPYCYDRMLDAVSSPSPLANPRANTVQIRGYDLQNDSLTLATTDEAHLNGSFSISSSNFTFMPAAYYGDSSSRLDPAGNQYRGSVFARYTDGLNASPFIQVRVLSFNADASSEGVPDSWRLKYFQSTTPAGPNHRANDDADGDGFSNLTEWLLGSTPTNKTSNLAITFFSKTNLQFQAKPYEVYELYSSTNLTSWSRAMNPIIPTNAVANITGFPTTGTSQFFRILKVP